MQMYSASCATLAFGNQTSALPNDLKTSKTLSQNPQHWTVLGAAQSVSWMPFAEAVLDAPEKPPTDSPRTRRQTPCPGGQSKLGGRADKGSPARREACVKFDRKASLECRKPKIWFRIRPKKCTESVHGVRTAQVASVRAGSHSVALCTESVQKSGSESVPKIGSDSEPENQADAKKKSRERISVYAIRPRLCTESVHNFVRIPYKNVNEKRPQRLPKRTPETRQIRYLEKAPKHHKMGAPGRRLQDLYERLVRGPSRNEGNNPWVSRGNASPRETVRAYAMRVNG